MKILGYIASFVLGATLAASVLQIRNTRERAVEDTAAQKAVDDFAAKEKSDAAQIESLQQKTKILTGESAALRQKLQTLDTAPSVAAMPEETPEPKAESKNGMAGFLDKMLSDPETKKAMAATQTMALRQYYTDFVKNAHLTPAEAEKFYELLGARQMKNMEAASAMLKGDKDLRDPSVAKEMEGAQKSADTDLNALLGTHAQEFHDYEKTLGDRIALSQLGQQLSTSGNALSADQNAGLLQIMATQRAQQPAMPQVAGTRGLNMSDEEMQRYFKSQEDLNARIRTQAMSLLTPPQMQALEAAQKQQIDMQKMGMTMARGMFGGKKDAP